MSNQKKRTDPRLGPEMEFCTFQQWAEDEGAVNSDGDDVCPKCKGPAVAIAGAFGVQAFMHAIHGRKLVPKGKAVEL